MVYIYYSPPNFTTAALNLVQLHVLWHSCMSVAGSTAPVAGMTGSNTVTPTPNSGKFPNEGEY